MHLGSLAISRFRSCNNVTVSLRPDLTVLVGENNGGKSNVVDAIRLLTLPLSGRRERYPEDEDVRRHATVPNFQIEGVFRGLGDTLKGLLISAVPDPTKDEAVFGYRYESRSERAPRGKTTVWAGRFDTNEPEAGSTDLIRHVYLPPLRDAHQALGTGSGARVMALLRHFLPKDEEQDFLVHVRRAEDRPDILTTMNTEIGAALGMLTNGVRPQTAALDFGAETLLDVARDLRFRLADSGLAPEDTVPASFQMRQRQDTMEACKRVGLRVDGHRLLDEPCAAFIDFACRNAASLGDLGGVPKRLLVVDFGGGTCDVALFELSRIGIGPIKMKSLAVSRYHRLGGGDIDLAIIHKVLVPALVKENGLSEFDLDFDEVQLRIVPSLLRAHRVKLSQRPAAEQAGVAPTLAKDA